MPGLFGLIHHQPSADIDRFLAHAAASMSHQPWHVAEHWITSTLPMGIGRVGIGIFNHAPQPLVSPDGNSMAWLCGEFYPGADLIRRFNLSAPAAGNRDLELALAAYQEWGTDFARHLKGVFFVLIYDIVRQRLVFANDRYGLYPHYYHVSPHKLVFAPEVKAILCAPGVTRKPDITAASEYFRFQQVLGEKTFHEGVFLFPYGSVAQYDLPSGCWSVQRYWDWDQIPDRSQISFDEATEQAGDLLQSAVERLSAGVRPGVFLSGGLDSRTLLGFIPPQSGPAVSATFGTRDSRDVIYAGQIAKVAGSRHFWFDLPDGKWVAENADLHLKITEGFHSWIHMHGITALPELRNVMDCNLTGWDGGTVMGHPDHVNSIYNYPVDEWTVALRTYQQFTQAYTWPGLTDAEERLLFTPEYGRLARGRAFESMLAEFSRFWNIRQDYAAEYFYIVNHCCRFTFHMITTLRSALEARFPFWDYDLIDFLYSLPPSVRRDQLLYRTIITRRMPKLALIPYDKQEFLPTVEPLLHNTHKIAVRAMKRLKLFPVRSQLYADYENYLRNDLYSWASGILFDPRTLQRGIFDPDFVRSLMNRHMAGKEDWILGKIAPLITYELVMREYFD